MCVEIALDRMSFMEARRALPELIDTAKSEEEKEHFRRLQEASDEEMKEIALKKTGVK
ncbi:hypothetical protein GW915_12630 [bacterium]|nr:hypothetical protein [bacterium]